MIMKTKKISVKGVEISVLGDGNIDFISLTDLIKSIQDGEQLIKNWLRNKNTIEFLGIWEQLNNSNFNLVEFDLIKKESGTNRFLMSVNQWVTKTGAIGIRATTGRYGGTYAHKDIAFEFCTWISPEFKLLLIKEFQRLKEYESELLNSEWSYKRFLSKVNYRIHTDSVKENIVSLKKLSPKQESIVYANEADILNLALFGMTAKEWRQKHANQTEICDNIRECANVHQLTVLANLESLNARLIRENRTNQERFITLRSEAIKQLESLSKISYNYVTIQSPHLKYTSTTTSTLSDIKKDHNGN